MAQHKHLDVLGVWFQSMPLLLNYRLNQIIKSNCVIIMIQWVTQSHSSMGFNLRPFENTFWHLMAAMKCSCIFLEHYGHGYIIMHQLWQGCFAVLSLFVGFNAYGLIKWIWICKIDLCLDIFGPYNCWENLFCQINWPRPPDPRFQIFSQFPDSRFFGLQFPDSRFFGPLFADSRCWFTPPPPL